MKRRQAILRKKLTVKAGYFGLSLLILFFLLRSISQSLFIQNPDRLNLIFYSQNPYILSLGSQDNVNYIVNFYPDLKILVPGGYGLYRVGAIGKLVYLEKKPDIYKRAFSSAASTTINLYFYNNKNEVYYGKEKVESIRLPGWGEVLFAKSNATFFDRLFLTYKLILLKPSDFTWLDPAVQTKKGGVLFSESDFAKEYQGFFYQRTYRNERQSVQIIYSKRTRNAELISRILEGSGIRVVDVTAVENVQKNCRIVYSDEGSKTANYLSSFFGCKIFKGETRLSDIIFYLDKEEENWAFE